MATRTLWSSGDTGQVALRDAGSGACVTYGQLGDWVVETDANFGRSTGPAGLAMVAAKNDLHSLTALLTHVGSERPVLLVDGSGGLSHGLQHQIDVYSPTVIHGVEEAIVGYRSAVSPWGSRVQIREFDVDYESYPGTGLLLATSGSTGEPKLVRLSNGAVQANARQIARTLALSPDRRAITSLPVHYSYGLSIVTSHVAVGAEVVVTDRGVVSREFWDAISKYEVDHLAGVPATYQMILRMRIDLARQKSLKTITQAGGRLSEAMRRTLHSTASDSGKKFFVMYGQTEATARMAVMPHELLPEKIGGVGLPVPGGRIEIGTEGHPDEIVFFGENVMLGTASTSSDLAAGDIQKGRLETGDLGYVDSDGVLFVTGRIKRIAKVFGVRVNLDDIERQFSGDFEVAAVADDDTLRVVTTAPDTASQSALARGIARQLGIHPTGVLVSHVDSLPLLPNGKVDYTGLAT